MATMTTHETNATLRTLARAQLDLLAATVAQMPEAADFAVPLDDLRGLLADAEVIPLPSNVRHLVAVGTRGPVFGETLHAHIGKGGLKGRGFYEERATAECFAGAHDLPPDGPKDGAA